MFLNIAICDDDSAVSEYLEHEVSAWADRAGNAWKISSFPSAEAFLFDYSENKSVDVLLLDIEMPGMNGMELARHLRDAKAALQIIFITGYSDYIFEGYDVSALHYLMKPVSRDKLWSVLDRAAALLERSEKKIILEGSGTSSLVPISEIRYIEVIGNYVTVYADRQYTVKATLASIESQLDEAFFRAGRSYIINLDRVRRAAKKEVTLTTGELVPLARGVYEKLMNAIINRR
ncbi:MAG: response regulator transcription factor [Clostridia bacterium]|nr:response regulator transcription factor [Clostridia bacterium]